MTRRDKWLNPPRREVAKYRAFKDEVRLSKVKVPERHHVIFVVPMPGSWSKKKKAEMDGKPHQQRPDADNFWKALLDAVFEEDSHIWDARVTKVWGYEGQIKIGELS